MRSIKFYREGEALYATSEFLFNRNTYSIGEEFDPSEVPARVVERLFGQWWIGHKEDLEVRMRNLYGSSFEQPSTNIEETPEETSEETSEGSVIEPESSLEDETVEVVEDTEDTLKVRCKGVVKEIRRNQLRSDGTLTKGALALFN